MICSVCNEKMSKSKTTRYHYVESGLTNVYLVGVTVWSCPKCSNEEVNIPDPAGLQRAIAHMLVSKESRLNGKEFRFLRTYLGHSGEDVATRFDVARETVSRWETGNVKLSGTADLALRHMVMFGEANHDYRVVDLKQILDARRRIKHLEAKFQTHWKITDKTA